MPELPDIVVYLDALAPRIVGQPLERARVTSPLLLRTADPPLTAAVGKTVSPKGTAARLAATKTRMLLRN